ncbi:hypothetical protein J3A83DRAFT_4221471 [Scleroderma citrinum]
MRLARWVSYSLCRNCALAAHGCSAVTHFIKCVNRQLLQGGPLTLGLLYDTFHRTQAMYLRYMIVEATKVTTINS